MGRRKWKLYQESTSRNYLHPLNNNVKKIGDIIQRGGDLSEDLKTETDIVARTPSIEKDEFTSTTANDVPNSRPNSRREEDETVANAADTAAVITNNTAATTTTIVAIKQEQEAEDRLKDWSPQSKCYFCVDGKLDSDHNNHGVLVSCADTSYTSSIEGRRYIVMVKMVTSLKRRHEQSKRY